MAVNKDLVIPEPVTEAGVVNPVDRLLGPEVPTDPGYAELTAQSLIRGGAGLISGAGAATEWAGDVTKVEALRKAGATTRGLMKKVVEGPVGKLEGPGFGGTFMERPSLKRAYGIAVEAVPSLGAAVTTGGLSAVGLRAAGMAAPKALQVGSAVAAGGLGLVEGAPQYIEAKEAGKTLGKASAIGAAATVGSAALEYLGISKILGMTSKGVLKGVGTGVVSEGAQEGTQQLWQNIVAKVGYDKGRSLFDGMAEAIIGGAGAGGVVGGITGHIKAAAEEAPTQEEVVKATMLSRIMPDSEIVGVRGKVATVIIQTPTGPSTITAPVDLLAHFKAANVADADLALAFDSVKVGMAAAQAEGVKEVKVETAPVDEPMTPKEFVDGAASRIVALRNKRDGREGSTMAIDGVKVRDDSVPKQLLTAAEKSNLAILEDKTLSMSATADALGVKVRGLNYTDKPVSEKKVPGTPPTPPKKVAPEPVSGEKAEEPGPQRVSIVLGKPDAISGVKYTDVAATEKALPPVPKDRVRLYRASSPTVSFGEVFDKNKLTQFKTDRKGDFYTADLAYADYFRETYGKDAVIDYVDVTNAEAEAAKLSSGEYILDERKPTPKKEKKVEAKKKAEEKKEKQKVEAKREKVAPPKVEADEKVSPAKLGKPKANGDPSTKEAWDVQTGIEGKSTAQILDFLVKTGPTPAYRVIASGVKRILADRLLANSVTTVKVIHKGDTSDIRTTARGSAATTYGKTPKVEITLKGADMTGHVGVSYEAVLHELLHAATTLAYRVGSTKVAKGSKLAKAVKDLDAIHEHIQYHLKTQRQLYRMGAITPSAFEKKLLAGGTNALASPREVLAWGLTNKDFQDFLDSVPLAPGKKGTLWSKFVTSIRTMMGLSSNADSALSELLEASETIMRTPTPAVMEGYAKLKKEATGVDEVVSEKVFEEVDEMLSMNIAKVDNAAKILSNTKSKLYQKYVQYAPQWLAVTPLHTLVQTFGKKIKQIKDLEHHLNLVVAAKTEIVSTSMKVHDEVETIAKKGVGVAVLNEAAAAASLYQMTPWENIYNQGWVPTSGPTSEMLPKARKAWANKKMKRATGLTYDQAHKKSVEAYNALKTNELKKSYRKTVASIASIRTREKNNLLKYIETVSDVTTKEGKELRASLMVQFNASFKEIHGAYWPLSRVGKYTLEYTDKKGVRNVRHFVDTGLRAKEKSALLKSGVDQYTMMEDTINEQAKGAVAIPRELMAQLSGAVEDKYMADVDPGNAEAVAEARAQSQGIVDNMHQIWLRWQPETSAMKNSMHRGSVAGFSEDMLRSYLDYMQHHASSIAWTEQGAKIENDMHSFSADISEKKKEGGVDVTMDRHLLVDMRKRLEAIQHVNVSPMASFVAKISTGWFMTSPSIALVQMSQLGVLTFPKLATMFGAGKAAAAMAKGTKEAFTKAFAADAMFADSKVNNTYEMRRATVTTENRGLPMAKGKNIGDRMYSNEAFLKAYNGLKTDQKKLLVLREAMARNLLDISAVHEAYELTKGKDPKDWKAKAFNYAMMPMSLSELASRKATVLSTLDLSQQDGKGFFESMEQIAEVVNGTLYSYAKEGKGRAMQGGLIRNILQFQHYRMMTGLRLAMLLKDSIRGESPKVKKLAQKEFIGIMGMTGLFAGSLGLPMSGIMFAILDLVLGDEDEPMDSKLVFTNWLRDSMGETAGDVAAEGVGTLAGLSISRRIGLTDIYGMQNDPPPGMHGRQLAAWWAASQLGPMFSVTQGWFQGYDEIINKGNYMKGLEVATPKPIKDMLKALRVGTEGLKTGQGKRLLADDAITPDELIMMALGFNANDISKAYSAERSLRKISIKISERRGRLARNAAKILVEGGDTSAVMNSIRDFNRKMPAFSITGTDIRPTVRKILRGEYGATGRRERGVARQYDIPVFMQ